MTELPWLSRFVDRFPGDPVRENAIRCVQGVLYSEVQPTPVRLPQLMAWSDSLANELGIASPSLLEDEILIKLLAGNYVSPKMKPYAARYGGHQFGSWAGQLGDGRAITLGEVVTAKSIRREFQLKGAGPTPYSRMADGRAVLRSSIREFLCSEAMYFLGIPTTRALSLVTTGEGVIRDFFYDGHPKAEPGAIICRVSPSFLRFGNFEILAAYQELSLLKDLAQFVIQDHYPELDPKDPHVYEKFLCEVSKKTAWMIAHWMRVGFVHGVMNTDNMSILGLTLDYGPYGWLESYDPSWTPNMIDADRGRYGFGNQPSIAQWNLTRLCEAFLPLVRDEARVYESLEIYRVTFEQVHKAMLSKKLGLESLDSQDTQELVKNLWILLQAFETDYTIFFRLLCDWTIEQNDKSHENPGDKFIHLISPAFYSIRSIEPHLREQWIYWSEKYTAILKLIESKDARRRAQMKLVNPKYVLRNYLAQNVIEAAQNGDFSPLNRLFRVLKAPYEDQPQEEDLAVKPPEWARKAPGYSTLSCSS